MNAMDFYLQSVDAQTWQDCEAQGLDPDAALTELPSPAPEAPSMIVEVAPPAIVKPPPAPAVRPPEPPQSPARRHRRVPQSPASAASARRHTRRSQSPTEAADEPQTPLYEAVTFQPTHRRPTKQPIVRSRPPLRQRAYDAPHAGRAARTLTAKAKGQELVKAWPCRTPIILDAANARREAKGAVHAPKVRIDLEWCYGFDTSIVGRNLFAIDHQRVMFACAALVVIYDVKKHAQKFFRGHGSRRVTALTVDRRIACSGDGHARPEVLVWDVETLQILHRLGSGFFHHHVLVLCLSPGAKALVAIDASETHNLGYWRLDDLRRLARLKKEKQEHQISAREAHAHWGGMASNDVASDDLRTKEQKPAACRRAEVHEPPAVYDACWMFEDDTKEELVEGDHAGAGAKPQFCTVGPGRHVKFWTASKGIRVDHGREDTTSSKLQWRVDGKNGSWPTKDETCPMFQCVFVASTQILLTGGGDGQVYAWKGRVCFAVFPVHGSVVKGVNPIRLSVDNDRLCTGDSSGRVRCWGAIPPSGKGSSAAGWRAGGAISVDADMRGVEKETSAGGAPLRDVCFLGDDMVALTSQGVLVRIESNGKQSVLLSGHFSPTPTTQLRACATLSDNRVATAGMDRLLCVWDTESKQLVNYTRLLRPARCVDCAHDKIAAGLDDGSVMVVDASTMKTLLIIKGGGHTKNEIEERRHRGLGPCGLMAAQSAGQQHEALNAQKVSDDGVDSVRLTSDKVAVGRRDGSLRVYAMDGTQVVSYNNCGSRIIQIDWDASSQYIRCATAAKELRWFDVTQKKTISAQYAAELRWESPTTVFGRHCVAAWSSSFIVASCHSSKGLLASGSDAGVLRLLKSPAVVRGAPGVDVLAHASSITSVRWSGDRLFTVGGRDRALLQWRVVPLQTKKPLSPQQKARASQFWKDARSKLALIAKTSHTTVGALPVDDDDEVVSQTSSSAARKTGARSALCHLCGAANPVTSRARHVAACEERWTRVHEAALAAPGDDLDDPGALPEDPHAGVDFDSLTMPELDAANVESERVFFEHALVPCEHCGRRFRRDALRKHRVSCTASRPFAKPLSRQGTERVKVSNWR